jgi:hypothetical protein
MDASDLQYVCDVDGVSELPGNAQEIIFIQTMIGVKTFKLYYLSDDLNDIN